jgi:hypothetical protein
MIQRFYIGDTIQELPQVAGPSAMDILLAPLKIPAALATAITQPEKARAIDNPAIRKGLLGFEEVSRLLLNTGVPANIVPWAAAQVAFETNGFTSRVSKDDANFSGIKWINKPYQDATKGRPAPEGGNYAHYADRNAWAKDFKRVISIGGQGAAINARSLSDYVARLKNNGYFTSDAGAYLRGLETILKVVPIVKEQKAQDLASAHASEAAKENAKKWDFERWWNSLSKVEKGLGIAAAAAVGIAIIRK